MSRTFTATRSVGTVLVLEFHCTLVTLNIVLRCKPTVAMAVHEKAVKSTVSALGEDHADVIWGYNNTRRVPWGQRKLDMDN